MFKLEIPDSSTLTNTEIRSLSALFATLAEDADRKEDFNGAGETIKVSDHVRLYSHPAKVAKDFKPDEGELIAAESFFSQSGRADSDPTPNLDHVSVNDGVRLAKRSDYPDLAALFPIPSADNPAVGAETEDERQLREFHASLAEMNPAIPATSGEAGMANPPNVLGLTLDKAGLPWDERIHSSGRKMNKGDGLWTAKRGRDESTVAAIEAELRAVLAIPSPNGQTVANVPVPSNVPVPGVGTTPGVTVPVPTAGNTTATVISASPSNGPTTFAELVPIVMSGPPSGKFSQADIAKAAAACGLPNFPSLAKREDLIPLFYKTLLPNG